MMASFLVVLEWAIYVAVCIFVLTMLPYVFAHRDRTVRVLALAMSIGLVDCLAVTAYWKISKFHLLWLLPAVIVSCLLVWNWRGVYLTLPWNRSPLAVKCRKIERIVENMPVAVFCYLTERFHHAYGEKAMPLALAIGNELLYLPVRKGSSAEHFLMEGRDVLEREIAALHDEQELLILIHLTLTYGMPLRVALGTIDASAAKSDAPFEQIKSGYRASTARLRRYGLLVPVDGITEDEFFARAERFIADRPTDVARFAESQE